MGLAKTKEELGNRANPFLKAKMKEADVTYAGLKLKRETFSATFFLACLAAMEIKGVVSVEI